MARSSSLSLFLLSIIPFLLLPRREELSVSDPSDLKFQGMEEDRYIVRFKVYKPSHEHRADLEHNLGGQGDWEWIDRNNPAKAFPTDFALLSFPSKKFAQISQRILSFDFVKDVFPEARYSRGLLSEDSEVIKKPGKLFTRMSCEIDEENNLNSSAFGFGRRLSMERSQITSMFGADNLWSKGYTGSKIKMAIFDTGIRSDHPHFRNIKERTNWTNEDTFNDNLGHGTFVAGVVASQNSQCLGFSPDAEIYAFRVFTDAQLGCRFRTRHGFLMLLTMLLRLA